MVVDFSGQLHHSANPAVAVTAHQVQRARAIIESMMPGQAANMDAVLLAGVAHALALQDSQRLTLHH